MGTFPETDEGIAALMRKKDDVDDDRYKGPYIENEEGLKDPWSNDFEYKAEGDKNEGKFDLWSVGPDGKSGTDDDIGNWKDDR